MSTLTLLHDDRPRTSTAGALRHDFLLWRALESRATGLISVVGVEPHTDYSHLNDKDAHITVRGVSDEGDTTIVKIIASELAYSPDVFVVRNLEVAPAMVQEYFQQFAYVLDSMHDLIIDAPRLKELYSNSETFKSTMELLDLIRNYAIKTNHTVIRKQLG